MYYLPNKILEYGYKWAIKPILFKMDPEKCHHSAVLVGKIMGKYALSRWVLRCFFNYSHPMLQQTIHGMHFANPIGLAAGFDKNAELIELMPSLGFGSTEVGSITGEPCDGNKKPRVWRIPSKKSLRINMGLNNDGAQIISQRLKKVSSRIPLGVSIAKTNCPETVDVEQGISDYVKAYSYLESFADYVTINISCPNAYGGQDFRDPQLLKKLLQALGKTNKPLFLKLSPDLSHAEIDALLMLCKQYEIAGVICGNLTKKHNQIGGLSGKAVAKQSTEMIKYITKKTKGMLTIIGCGGVFSAQDAYEKLQAGASLIQLITGMIYEGPQLVNEINRGLVKIMKQNGITSISSIARSK